MKLTKTGSSFNLAALAREMKVRQYADACNVDYSAMVAHLSYDPLARQQFQAWKEGR